MSDKDIKEIKELLYITNAKLDLIAQGLNTMDAIKQETPPEKPKKKDEPIYMG